MRDAGEKVSKTGGGEKKESKNAPGGALWEWAKGRGMGGEVGRGSGGGKEVESRKKGGARAPRL